MNVLEPKGVCGDADGRSITGKSAEDSEREQVSRPRWDAKRYAALAGSGERRPESLRRCKMIVLFIPRASLRLCTMGTQERRAVLSAMTLLGLLSN